MPASSDVTSQIDIDTEDAAKADIAREENQRKCTFFFVDAAYLRSLEEDAAPLPSFQRIRETLPGVLVQRTIDVGDAYRGAYASEFLAVSHRWEHPDAPDTKGEQQRAVCRHVRNNSEITAVWYDYWSMPQGGRSPAEKVRFKYMLQNVNLCYLGMRVLVLADISYLSRFWTQFEAWLSMRQGGPDGLGTPHSCRQRCTVECLHNATKGSEDMKLRQMLADVSSAEAHVLLSKPDVTVTNQGDKEMQLAKVKTLDGEVRAAWSVSSVQQLRAAGVSAEALPVGFADEVLRDVGFTTVERGVRAYRLLSDGDHMVRHEAYEQLVGLENSEHFRIAAVVGAHPESLSVEVLRSVQQLENPDSGVRSAALKVLARLEAAPLGEHAAAIVPKLEDTEDRVRFDAVQALDRLEAAALAQHTSAFLAKLNHPVSGVRSAALKVLGKLEAATLGEHAAAIVAKLEDTEDRVRFDVVKVLGKLEAAALAQHTSAFLAKLNHPVSGVRSEALKVLGKLEAATLAEHAMAVVAKLEDTKTDVRSAALKVLGKLEAATLAEHAMTVVAKLEDTDTDVRSVAVQTLRKLEPEVLANHVGAVVAATLKGQDLDFDNASAAVLALSKVNAAGLLSEEHKTEWREAIAGMAATLAEEEEDYGMMDAVMNTVMNELDAAELAPHVGTFIAKLKHPEYFVRVWAMDLLGKLEAAALKPHATAIAAKLKDKDEGMVRSAVLVLGKLKAAALLSKTHTTAWTKRVELLVAELRLSSGGYTTIKILHNLGGEMLAQHAAVIVSKLRDPDLRVRSAALEALGKLEEAALTEHAMAVAAKLEDSDYSVRARATLLMASLNVATLAQHTTAIVTKLEDSEFVVRAASVALLSKLDRAALLAEEHLTAWRQSINEVVATLEHVDRAKRHIAVQVLGKLDAGMLTNYAQIIAKLQLCLADSDGRVRSAAVETLSKL